MSFELNYFIFYGKCFGYFTIIVLLKGSVIINIYFSLKEHYLDVFIKCKFLTRTLNMDISITHGKLLA